MKKQVLVGVILAGVFFGTTAAQGDGIPHPTKPEQFWPASWVALGMSFLFLADIVSRLFGLYRVGAGALEKKLDEQTKHFDKEIIDLKEELNQQFNHFTENAELRMNGFGKRLADVESDQVGANATMTSFESRMSASEMDREHIRLQLGRIEDSQKAILNHILKLRD